MKIYARQVNPVYQDSRLFSILADGTWRWDNSFWDSVSVLPRRGYFHIMTETVETVHSVLEDGSLASVLESMQDGSDDVRYEDIRDEIITYIPFAEACDVPQVETIARCVTSYGEKCVDSLACLCTIMQAIDGKIYDHKCIRGCCQDEWRYIVYPIDEYSDSDISHLEMELFNSGSEWEVEEHEDDSPFELDSMWGDSIYCHEWNDDGIRSELAEMYGVKPSDVVLYRYKGQLRWVDSYERIGG